MGKEDRVLVGYVGVDSGQVMICDPCYIDSEWKHPEDDDEPCVPPEIWRDKKTGKTYAYKGFRFLQNGIEVDVPFENWNVKLKDYNGKTPNEVRMSGVWEKAEVPEEFDHSGEFSYRGCCAETLSEGFGQLNHKLGHPGAGIASRTNFGDGEYPVYAELDRDGCPTKLTIEFVGEEDDDEDS